ncbi:MAG: uridylate kinase, partial [Roseiflexaceae bacterium]|nr:uridylate kinase [Roseiflexaceae bacterium]
QQLAQELRAALDAGAGPLVLGHGSGSYGHVYAKRYGVHTGIAPGGDWMGYALTSAAALRLNRIVVDALLAAGVPALALQPSASLVAQAGALERWDTGGLRTALGHGLLPVIHGDVAFDQQQGSAIIATEQLLVALAADPELRPARVILVGESGVYTADPRANPAAERIPVIDSANIEAVLALTGGSHGVDVTGGMRGKVALMWQLIESNPTLSVQLIGSAPGLLQRALIGQAQGQGTLIRR